MNDPYRPEPGPFKVERHYHFAGLAKLLIALAIAIGGEVGVLAAARTIVLYQLAHPSVPAPCATGVFDMNAYSIVTCDSRAVGHFVDPGQRFYVCECKENHDAPRTVP